jgi:hypothetical protein
MALISLKNSNGTGPRGVIDLANKHHVILPGGEEADIDVDDHTAAWLTETWESGGDLEVVGGAPARSSKNKEQHPHPEGRAKL